MDKGNQTHDKQGYAFEYQLDLLKLEIETINGLIDRLDGMTQTTKNWLIITWAGGLTFVLGNDELRSYAILTAIFPLLFWFVDAYWRRLQRRSIYRSLKIHEFVNSDRFISSFEQQRLTDFTVYDPAARQYIDSKEFQRFISLTQTIFFPEVLAFYLMPFLISLGIGLYVLEV